MWINVEDKLPNENETCIIKIEYVYQDRMFDIEHVGVFNNGTWKCYDLDKLLEDIISVRVTDWKPIEYKEVNKMQTETKFVYFDKYCILCKNVKTVETEDPCNDCLATPVNINSHKPVNFEEA